MITYTPDVQRARDAVAECYRMSRRGIDLMWHASECNELDEATKDAMDEMRVHFVHIFDQCDMLVRPMGIHIDPRYDAINAEVDAAMNACEECQS